MSGAFAFGALSFGLFTGGPWLPAFGFAFAFGALRFGTFTSGTLTFGPDCGGMIFGALDFGGSAAGV